jgi:hypothetical protein
VPLAVIEDEARKCHIPLVPTSFMIGYAVGAAVARDRTLLTPQGEAQLRFHVRAFRRRREEVTIQQTTEVESDG